MPPCLCWRPSECCSWVNNVFSNQLILLQADAQANAWSNQSQPMEPIFCRLLTLSHKVNCSWLCDRKKSEHPAEDMLETALGRTALGQRSRCFSLLSCRTAEIHVARARASPHCRGAPCWSSTWTRSLPSRTSSALQALYLGCCCGSKISEGSGEQQNSVFKWFANCGCAKFAFSTSTSHMQERQLTSQ